MHAYTDFTGDLQNPKGYIGKISRKVKVCNYRSTIDHNSYLEKSFDGSRSRDFPILSDAAAKPRKLLK